MDVDDRVRRGRVGQSGLRETDRPRHKAGTPSRTRGTAAPRRRGPARACTSPSPGTTISARPLPGERLVQGCRIPRRSRKKAFSRPTGLRPVHVDGEAIDGRSGPGRALIDVCTPSCPTASCLCLPTSFNEKPQPPRSAAQLAETTARPMPPSSARRSRNSSSRNQRRSRTSRMPPRPSPSGRRRIRTRRCASLPSSRRRRGGSVGSSVSRSMDDASCHHRSERAVDRPE